ncbi:MAG: LysE/ArgO family amino acid transporter [Alphaproteobacteria bacterium]|jgi:L-lysine exporter family protein LysE/ArgO|uniref:LysE/ArgO family amino acid transporter n=1 Tax=Rhizobium/Agrobacterium group TaxID=227290 RepID=UPI00083E59B7|nr:MULTISPECIES: LysE/ArgO family amino acid transporter [unclassified Agrobacterium]MBU0737447.1 LysE/ArgO family amino acid transporter [Alphaproteobacteria bacterium]MDM7979905.1 LysE/ArgO family amino acid transporter [Rhizobium sp.]AOG08177.1 lysE type translocator family protein [Agrobacterium sp. RAC06]MBU0833794.1 LysE/ArgO family amino acid transporter [Alphaproteobacteria bacterium]MBU1766036.1 LysE/ArgO family amino acid transporter [Alphaproteobacteria bacterium]
MFTAATAGFLLGLSLIVAIGAQNAFILRQGLRREHVLPLVLTCAISDAILIALGVAGFATVLSRLDWLEPVMRYGGAAFLIVYALRSAHSAWAGGASLRAGETPAMSMKAAFLTCLAFTWLNPHVYLDTVVLLGSISTRYAGQETAFALGAMTASFTFFFSLGYGARLLAPLFARPVAWRVLDGLIAFVMAAIALKLIL